MSSRAAAQAATNAPAPGQGIARRCVVGVGFLTTVNGILNIVTMVSELLFL